MTSSLDTTKPTNVDPSITTIRENFVKSANDIEDIQLALTTKKDNIINTIGITKLWPSAGSVIPNRVGETSIWSGTTYQKMELEAQPYRVRARLTQRANTPCTFVQSGRDVIVNYTGQAIKVGDKVYVKVFSNTTGQATSGWRIVTKVTKGVNITYKTTSNDIQEASGSMLLAHPSKNWKVSFAMTETDDNSTTNNAYTPIVNGVSNNVPYSSSNVYGWQTADFNVDITQDPIFYTDIPSPIMDGQYSHGVSFSFASEWIYLPRVLPVTGTRPFLLMRTEHDAVNGGDYSVITMSFINNSLTYEPNNAPYYRKMFNKFNNGLFGVTSVTDLPVDLVQNTCAYTMFEVDYGVQTESVLGIGDSTLAHSSYGISINGVPSYSPLGSYLNKAVLSKSTHSKPYTVYNGGMSGHPSITYFNQLFMALKSGLVPTILVIQGHSINDGGSITQKLINDSARQILKAIDLGRKAGIKKILVCTWPMTQGTYNAVEMRTLIENHNTWIKSLVTNKIIDGSPDFYQVQQDLTLPIFFSVDGTTPSPAAVGGVTPDRIHQGPAGINGMVTELTKFL